MDKTDVIKSKVELLLMNMVDKYNIEVEEEGGVYNVQIGVENDAPTIIGRHGETIRALQKILEVMLFKSFGESITLVVNVNDYREKQQERLEYIANEAAQRVISSHDPSYLRGFSSFERRIMHEYITKNYPQLTSYSVGEGRDRRLVIEEKKEE